MKSTKEYIRILKAYKEKVSERYGIKQLGIFGSVARGEQTEGSDLDVCVEMEKPDAFIMLDIKYDLEDMLHCKVDITLLNKKMNQLLKRHIERDGIYV
jgi:predicted nucleotidyltransferase